MGSIHIEEKKTCHAVGNVWLCLSLNFTLVTGSIDTELNVLFLPISRTAYLCIETVYLYTYADDRCKN